MIDIAIPGGPTLHLSSALIDFNGTLARDGVLVDGVAARLSELTKRLDVYVVTGDTTGTARQELAGFPIRVQVTPVDDQEAAKCAVLDGMNAGEVVAIGNGRNDRGLMERAGLSIVVIGDEGCSVDALRHADVACASIVDALDLLLVPRRLVATLRR